MRDKNIDPSFCRTSFCQNDSISNRFFANQKTLSPAGLGFSGMTRARARGSSLVQPQAQHRFRPHAGPFRYSNQHDLKVVNGYLDSAMLGELLRVFGWYGFDFVGVDTEFGQSFSSGLLVGLAGLGIAASVIVLALGFFSVELFTSAWRKVD